MLQNSVQFTVQMTLQIKWIETHKSTKLEVIQLVKEATTNIYFSLVNLIMKLGTILSENTKLTLSI